MYANINNSPLLFSFTQTNLKICLLNTSTEFSKVEEIFMHIEVDEIEIELNVGMVAHPMQWNQHAAESNDCYV